MTDKGIDFEGIIDGAGRKFFSVDKYRRLGGKTRKEEAKAVRQAVLKVIDELEATKCPYFFGDLSSTYWHEGYEQARFDIRKKFEGGE